MSVSTKLRIVGGLMSVFWVYCILSSMGPLFRDDLPMGLLGRLIPVSMAVLVCAPGAYVAGTLAINRKCSWATAAVPAVLLSVTMPMVFLTTFKEMPGILYPYLSFSFIIGLHWWLVVLLRSELKQHPPRASQ